MSAESRQTIADAIKVTFPNIFNNSFESLLLDTQIRQDEFFTVYAQATNALQQEIAVKSFFGMDIN